MKKFLFILSLTLVSVLANSSSSKIIEKMSASERIINSNPLLNSGGPTLTIQLSCVEITYTNQNTIAVFLALNTLGLGNLVIANLESRWCPPQDSPAVVYA